VSRVATQLGELRDAVGEIGTLVARAADSLDHAPRSGADPLLVDPLLVEFLAYVFGEVARSATRAASRLDGLRGVAASAQPKSSSERRDGGGTAPGTEMVLAMHDGLLVWRPASYSREADVVQRLRERCAAAFKLTVDYPFFNTAYMPGETPDEALWRIFQSEKLVRGWMDGAVMEVLIYGNELPIPEEFAPTGLADADDGSDG
jgi:hypothetical protein